MPIAIVKLKDRANRVINVVKAKYGLKDKSEAINRMAEEYEDEVLEPEVRPEYLKKLERISKEKPIKIKDVDSYFENLRKR
ncbi:MAG: DUF2683 family protein [archaeon]